MSRQVHLSIVGLERLNGDIWDFMVYPDGWTEEQKSDLLDCIRMECYELEVIYTDSIFMMNAIGRWARKEKPVWNALKKTMEYSYNPIENTDRYEEETITDTNEKTSRDTNTVTRTGNQTGTSQKAGQISETGQKSGTSESDSNSQRNGTGNVTNSGNDITVNEVQGYDSNAYAPHDKSTVTYGGIQNSTTGETITAGEETTTTESDNRMHNENETLTDVKDTNETETGNRNGSESSEGTRGRTLHTHGNIGTMTVQQMIREEREIAEFNLVDYIVDSFKQRFCILVY